MHRFVRRHLLGHMREIDDIGKHHSHIRMSVGDIGFLPLQPLGNRRRQDIQQQAFREFFLGLDRMGLCVNRIAQLGLLAGEVPKQHIHHCRDRDEIQHEKNRHGLLVQLLYIEAQLVIEHARHRRHENVGNEPGHRFLGTHDHDRADRRQQRPQRNSAGIDEIADRPLQHKWGEQEQRELHQAKRRQLARFQVENNGANRDELEGQWNQGREALAETPVNRQPQHRGEHHQAGREQQHVARKFFFRAQLIRSRGLEVGQLGSNLAGHGCSVAILLE